METQLVVFRLANEDFGVPIGQVKEINRLVPITSIPKAPPAVLGVINLRGRIIPVFSLRQRLGFDRGETDDATRIVVAEVGSETIGFVVDAVTEVLRLEDTAIEPAPEGSGEIDSTFIRGIGKVDGRLIIVLDVEKVFGSAELSEAS
ncbi:MAG: chemotaxis protein CheW [Betaproteobacteria bacterium]